MINPFVIAGLVARDIVKDVFRLRPRSPQPSLSSNSRTRDRYCKTCSSEATVLEADGCPSPVRRCKHNKLRHWRLGPDPPRAPTRQRSAYYTPAETPLGRAYAADERPDNVHSEQQEPGLLATTTTTTTPPLSPRRLRKLGRLPGGSSAESIQRWQDSVHGSSASLYQLPPPLNPTPVMALGEDGLQPAREGIHTAYGSLAGRGGYASADRGDDITLASPAGYGASSERHNDDDDDDGDPGPSEPHRVAPRPPLPTPPPHPPAAEHPDDPDAITLAGSPPTFAKLDPPAAASANDELQPLRDSWNQNIRDVIPAGTYPSGGGLGTVAGGGPGGAAGRPLQLATTEWPSAETVTKNSMREDGLEVEDRKKPKGRKRDRLRALLKCRKRAPGKEKVEKEGEGEQGKMGVEDGKTIGEGLEGRNGGAGMATARKWRKVDKGKGRSNEQ